MSERSVKRARRASRCPSLADLDGLLTALAHPSGSSHPAELIDRIDRMERLKGALAAAQARETVAFKRARLAEEEAAGVPARRRGTGIAAEVALARRESPRIGSRLVGLADALVAELPHTMAALTAGDLSEWRATLVTRETACLTREHRVEVDKRLSGSLAGLSDRQVERETRRHAYHVDPHAFVKRSSQAAKDRHVSIRPAPDVMTRVSALLPAEQGVAIFAALTTAADTARAAGDERSRSQVMVDTLVERTTGQARADQTPVEVQLLMTDESLLGAASTPAVLQGYGPVPAPWARALVRRLDTDTQAWIRRLLTDPVTGRLTALDTRRRFFGRLLRLAVVIRDQLCRTPYCGAPIRHLDHVVPIEDGGDTSEANGQGLCESCNYAKQAPGWRARPDPVGGAGLFVTVTTPTGHTHQTRPPPLLCGDQLAAPRVQVRTPLDIYWTPTHPPPGRLTDRFSPIVLSRAPPPSRSAECPHA